ncbi:MAG: hypothetical protein ABFC42_10150 [Sulfuricella sp.]
MTTITVVLDPPQPSDTQEVFNNKAFATLGDLNTWADQANTVAGEVNANKVSAESAASTATTQAGLATTSATNAFNSAAAAGVSETNAANSASAAAASYDAFDDRYLGAKAADPALDNDGNALLTGAMYWNTGINRMKCYTGSAWAVEFAAADTVSNAPAGNISATTVQAAINELDTEKLAVGTPQDTKLFAKADSSSVVFTKTGAGTVSVKAGTLVAVNGKLITFAAQTAVTMPALTAGTDYAIYVCDDGTMRADASMSAPSGYTTTNSRKIGGFHYAPGGNATGVAGGDTTPAINAYSLWDLKFRPACVDPRGMALVADSFWADIYLCGVDHLTNGTSKYNVTIADGASPPKIPTKFGGNGSTAYTTLNWWEANEVLQSWGKRSPTYDEFAALAYGTTEATSSGGTDVPTTGVSGTGATSTWNKFTSKWGVIQASGCLWVWGGEFGGGAAAAAWTANTGGRGSTYQMENAALFGGFWGDPSLSGSRASHWGASPPLSFSDIGARGVCDHLIID